MCFAKGWDRSPEHLHVKELGPILVSFWIDFGWFWGASKSDCLKAVKPMLFWHFWNSFLFFWDIVLEDFFASFRIFLGPQPLAKHTPVDAKAHSGTTKAHSGKHAPTNTKARPNRHQSTLSGCSLVTVGVCFGTGWGVLSQNTSQPWLVCVGGCFDEWKITRPSARWVNAGGRQRKTKIIPAKHPDRFYMNLSWSHFDPISRQP